MSCVLQEEKQCCNISVIKGLGQSVGGKHQVHNRRG